MVFSHVLVRHLPKKYLSHKDIRDYMTPPAPGSFALLPVSPQEIIDTPIAGISKSTRSAGPDGVDPLVARNTVVNIAEVLSDVINSSFVTGHIPQQLKIVKITPIFKQGDKMIISNYRPISILSYFAKIMEKAMYNRLSSYVNRMSLLYPRQYGSRPGHSTDMALINIHDVITKAIDTSKFSIGIFLDLAKAFDTVDHTILTQKLEHYGVRGIPLTWFKNYLYSRLQQVQCNGALSSLT